MSSGLSNQAVLRRQLAIGIGTAVGSMVVVAIIVLTLLVLYRNHREKHGDSHNVSDEEPRRVGERSGQPRLPPDGSTSASSQSEEPVHQKDVRLSLDNFSFGSTSLHQTEDLAVRLENELERDRRSIRRGMDIYDADIPNNVLLNYSYNDSAFGSNPNQQSFVNGNHLRETARQTDRYDLHDPHLGRSISHEPYIRPTERFDDSVQVSQHRSHSFDADRYLLDQSQPSRQLSNYVPKTMPARTRNLDRDRYFGDDVVSGSPPHRRSDLESELTGYFDSPLDKRYRFHTVAEEGHANSDFHRNPELWTHRFDYSQFSRLPRTPLSFSGNRRFLTEHPQRNIMRPI